MTLRSSRGQAALEFLSTYGFVFVSLAVVLGLIFYFGIFDFASLRNNDCTFAPGLRCVDYTLTFIDPGSKAGYPARRPVVPAMPGNSYYMQFVVANAFGVNITGNQLMFDMIEDINKQRGDCWIMNERPPNVVFPWQPGENRTIYCPLAAGAQYYPRTRYDGSLRFRFNQTGGLYTHNVTATFSITGQ